jgi:hypothetical protein
MDSARPACRAANVGATHPAAFSRGKISSESTPAKERAAAGAVCRLFWTASRPPSGTRGLASSQNLRRKAGLIGIPAVRAACSFEDGGPGMCGIRANICRKVQVLAHHCHSIHTSSAPIRWQVILGLCGLVITVTGFSGGNIIKAGSVSSGFMVAGIVFVLAAVSVAMCSLVRIRWVMNALLSCPAIPACNLHSIFEGRGADINACSLPAVHFFMI